MSLEKLNFTAVQFHEDGTIFFTTTKKYCDDSDKVLHFDFPLCSSMIMISYKYPAMKSNFVYWKKYLS